MNPSVDLLSFLSVVLSARIEFGTTILGPISFTRPANQITLCVSIRGLLYGDMACSLEWLAYTCVVL